VLTHK